MNHPTNRLVRRNNRAQIIAYRRFIYEHIWHSYLRSTHHEFLKMVVNPLVSVDYLLEWLRNDPNLNIEEWVINWGIYSKWNCTCDPAHCRMCSYERASRKRENKQRRKALKRIDADWEQQYED